MVSARRHELAFGQFRVHDLLFRVAVIRVQIERNQPVANAVFLALPALEVGLSQFYRVHPVARRHHRDQFRRGGSRRRRQRLPPVFPEALVLRGEVSLPVLVIGCFIGSLNHKQLAPVTDEGDLNLYRRVECDPVASTQSGPLRLRRSPDRCRL